MTTAVPDFSAAAQQFVDLPEEERKLLQRLFKKLGTYPPKVLAQTLSQINYLGLIKLDGNGYPFPSFSLLFCATTNHAMTTHT